MPAEIEMGQLPGAGIGPNELLDGRDTITDHVRKALKGQRYDLTMRLARLPHPEHARLPLEVNEGLQHQPFAVRKGGQIGRQFGLRQHRSHTGASAAKIGLGHQGKAKAGLGSSLESPPAGHLRQILPAFEADVRRERTARLGPDQPKHCLLRLADDATPLDRWIGDKGE
jgi:hypothetical protein